jgi:hypothetical protein
MPDARQLPRDAVLRHLGKGGKNFLGSGRVCLSGTRNGCGCWGRAGPSWTQHPYLALPPLIFIQPLRRHSTLASTSSTSHALNSRPSPVSRNGTWRINSLLHLRFNLFRHLPDCICIFWGFAFGFALCLASEQHGGFWVWRKRLLFYTYWTGYTPYISKSRILERMGLSLINGQGGK